MTKLQAIRQFGSQVIGKKLTISRHRMSCNWGMVLLENTPRLCVPSDLNYKEEEEDIIFYNNFVSRYNEAKNFSPVTLTLLHEFGHWETQDLIDWYLDTEERDNAETIEEYVNIPSEFIATEWAIKWLHNKEHQQNRYLFKGRKRQIQI